MLNRHLAWLALGLSLPLQAATLQPADFARIKVVASPRLSPDGQQIAYTVDTTSLADDQTITQLWLADWDGRSQRQLTFGEQGISSPAFSPDGRSIAFLANRSGDDDAPTQLWRLDLRGGEAQQIGASPGDVVDFDWSPDGQRIVLVVHDPEPKKARLAPASEARPESPRPDAGVSGDDKSGESRDDDADDPDQTPPPIVIDRFQFKQDVDGYLRSQRAHLALLDVASGKIESLTHGDWDDLSPAWSPDGKRIAFVSKRGLHTQGDADRDDDWNVYVIDAQAGAKERVLTTSPRADNLPDWESRLAWSPDSRRIAYLSGGEPRLIEYATHGLAVIDADGGTAVELTATLDRNVSAPHWIDGGKGIAVLVEQDRRTMLARVDARSGKLSTLRDEGERGTLFDFDASANGRYALLASAPKQPAEITAWQRGQPRAISHQNDAFVGTLTLANVEPLSASSPDGTEVHGFLTRPAQAPAGKPLPTVLFIHGGPASQFEASFRYDWQLFAAQGYAVVAMNPRGSTGRGTDYAAALFANWGGPDVGDVLAGVDAAVAAGVADREKLVVGGWSYGGMLTNYVIARDTRFKAAVSGASISNVLAGYGTDQYIRDYEHELGKPWEHLDAWLRVSYPFLHADRIKTPTLFMGGSEDYNVPLLAQEQMYQALRSLGVPTRLVIYPGQHHGLDKPSYILDRWQRWLAWYATHLQPATP